MSSNATTAAPSDGYEYDENYMWYSDYPEYKAGILIWKIVPPILIFLGTVGNILSVIVLQRRALRTSTTAFYLTVLAFSDLLVLHTGLSRQWINNLFEIDVRHISEFGCKLHVFLVYFSLDMSAWILMAVTLERIISVWLPHSAKSKCSKKTAMILLSTVAAFLAALNSHLFYGIGTRIMDNGEVIIKCIPIDDDYQTFFNYDWTWIDLCAFCLIPFTFIVIGNTLILVKVIKSQRRTKTRVNPVTGNGNVATANRRGGGGGGGKKSSMTTILLTLNIVFLVTTSPVSVYNIGYFHWVLEANHQEFAQLDMWWAIVTMLQYTNNSLNFLLYCLSGPTFRQEFLIMIRGCVGTIAKLLANGIGAIDVKPATNGNDTIDVKPVTNSNGAIDVKPATNGNDAIDVKPAPNGNGAIDVKLATKGNGAVDVNLANNTNGVVQGVPLENGSCQDQITTVTADMGREDTSLSISLHPIIAFYTQSTGIDSTNVSRACSSHI